MIHGYFTRIINTLALPGCACPHCGNNVHMQIEVLAQVNHIMFILFYPSKKRAVITCTLCGTSYKPFAGYTNDGAEIIANTRHKWYHFTGLFFLILFMCSALTSVALSISEKKKSLREDFANIKTGSVIFYDTKDGKQTCMKIKAIKGDSIWATENLYTTNKNPEKLDEDKNYDTEQTIFLKQGLQKGLDNGDINNIYN